MLPSHPLLHPPMTCHGYVEEIGSAAILATKRSVGVTPEVYLRKCVTYTPPANGNKAAFSGDVNEVQNGISVAPQKTLMSSNLKKKNF